MDTFSVIIVNRNGLFVTPHSGTNRNEAGLYLRSVRVARVDIKKMARQNFSKAAEDALNEQINAELTASLVYRSMASHFDRDDVALAGFRKFFLHNAEEETEHAQKFIDYVNRRGGRVVLQAIAAPKTEWTSALEALEDAMALERLVNDKLLKLHAVADAANDPQMTDFIEGEFLNEQVEAIKDLADKITNLKRVGDGLGVFLFDQKMSS
jgi:ferritin heavy chain